MKKRDVIRFLCKGRPIIAAAALLCGALCAFLAFGYTEKEHILAQMAELPDADGEYIRRAETLDAYIENLLTDDSLSPNVKAELRNVRKYPLAAAYGEILNSRAAVDIESLVKSYESRRAQAEKEAQSLNELAWQAYNNAENGPYEAYAQMMEEYAEKAVLSAEKSFEAQYCENILRLMTDENVPSAEDAEEKARDALQAVLDSLDKIRRVRRSLPLPWEICGALGVLAGGILCGIIIVAVRGGILTARLKKQKKYQSESAYSRVMDRVNFRG